MGKKAKKEKSGTVNRRSTVAMVVSKHAFSEDATKGDDDKSATKLKKSKSNLKKSQSGLRSKGQLSTKSLDRMGLSSAAFDSKKISATSMETISESSEEEEKERVVTTSSKALIKKESRSRTIIKSRGSRGKKREEPEPLDPAVEAEIMRLKDEYDLAEKALEEAGLKPPPKKMKPTEKAYQEKLLLEKLKAQAIENIKRRTEEEKLFNIEKEKREHLEHIQRVEIMTAFNTYYTEVISFNKNRLFEKKANRDWELYVGCRKLPNPAICSHMNTYLHKWFNVIKHATIKDLSQRVEDVLELMEELELLIDSVIDPVAQKMDIDNWKWVRDNFKYALQLMMDITTYNILRNIEKRMRRIDILSADYRYKHKFFTMGIWLLVQLPTPLPNPRRQVRPRVHVDFVEMKLEILLPSSIPCNAQALRALYLSYDHLSSQCSTYEAPPYPEYFFENLLFNVDREYRERLKLKYLNEHKLQHQEAVQKAKEDPNLPKPGKYEEPTIDEDEIIPVVPYTKMIPCASETVLAVESEMYEEERKKLEILNLEENDVNLRKYMVLGGVYFVNLVKQPPQPQKVVIAHVELTLLSLPKELQEVPVKIEYTPPPPPDPEHPRSAEELDKEMRQLEEDYETMIYITIQLPDQVMFLEPPFVCQWNNEAKKWTKDDIYDFRMNEEKGTLTFRCLNFGCYSLATYKYSNLPFQSWDIKPEENGSVTLQISAAILVMEFNVKGDVVALTDLQNAPNAALSHIRRRYYSLGELKFIMKKHGVDVFPDPDTFLYVEGTTCEKHGPTENILYFSMAQVSSCHQMSWSRWNVTTGRRNLVFLSRLATADQKKLKPYATVLVTPHKANYIDCPEANQEFSDEVIEGSKFYPTFMHLIKGTVPVNVRKTINEFPSETVFTLYELYKALRFMSFS